MHDLVPIAHVSDVERSATFYGLLGFTTVGSRRVDGAVDWAWLKSGEAEACLMVERAAAPVDPARQGVLLHRSGESRRLVRIGLDPGRYNGDRSRGQTPTPESSLSETKTSRVGLSWAD